MSDGCKAILPLSGIQISSHLFVNLRIDLGIDKLMKKLKNLIDSGEVSKILSETYLV